MSFEIDDGGRSLSKRPGQNNDCVIRALAVVMEREYDEIYDEMKELGRKAQQGTLNRTWTSWLLAEGAVRVEWEEEPLTVKQFLQEYEAGRFICHIPGHAFAVVDGVIHDTHQFRLGVKLKGVFEWPSV